MRRSRKITYTNHEQYLEKVNSKLFLRNIHWSKQQLTRKQFWNEKEVNLHIIDKPDNLKPPDIKKAKIKRRSKVLLEQLMKDRSPKTLNSKKPNRNSHQEIPELRGAGNFSSLLGNFLPYSPILKSNFSNNVWDGTLCRMVTDTIIYFPSDQCHGLIY